MWIFEVCEKWYQSMVTRLVLNEINTKTIKETRKVILFYFWFDSLTNRKIRITLFFAGKIWQK